EYLAVLHHKADILKKLDVHQGIARNSHDVGISPRRNHAQLPFHLQQFRGPRCRALDRLHRRHAEFDHPRKLLRDRLAPRNAPDVSPESNLDARLQRLAKRYFVLGCALAVALPVRSIGGRPVNVINTESWAKPGTLPDHLCDLRISQYQSVLDRVA